LLAVAGFAGGASAALLGFGFAGGELSGAVAGAASVGAASVGAAPAGVELGAASAVDGGALAGALPAAGLAVVLLAGLAAGEFAGAPEDGSVAGWMEGVVVAAPGLPEAGGVVAVVSVASGFCADADGLLVPRPSHPNF